MHRPQDILLLHRPDPLVEPEDVAKAFDELHRRGWVRFFGVSNHTPAQIELLKKYVDQPLVINQIEINLLHSHLINEGIIANQEGGSYTAAAGTLDYCRGQGMLIQAWSPVAVGKLIAPSDEEDERVRNTAARVRKLAQEKGTSPEAVAIAWLLRHPAPIQPIIGTTSPERVVASCLADGVTPQPGGVVFALRRRQGGAAPVRPLPSAGRGDLTLSTDFLLPDKGWKAEFRVLRPGGRAAIFGPDHGSQTMAEDAKQSSRSRPVNGQGAMREVRLNDDGEAPPGRG